MKNQIIQEAKKVGNASQFARRHSIDPKILYRRSTGLNDVIGLGLMKRANTLMGPFGRRLVLLSTALRLIEGFQGLGLFPMVDSPRELFFYAFQINYSRSR
ncbi:hypothetical protein [Paenibacillus sp. LHD-117]|uniref:hypothetical protein n=1 Tax=Paenibacillus sp. LHD-117 TaxID=3071412 RepID=UPI0035A98220